MIGCGERDREMGRGRGEREIVDFSDAIVNCGATMINTGTKLIIE